MDILENYINKYKHKGFVGPKYKGWGGKIKLFFQDNFIHNEIIHIAEPHDYRFNEEKVNPDVVLKIINEYNECSEYIARFEDAYYKGYTKNWGKYFKWGDKLGLVLVNDKVFGFSWFHSGISIKKTHYIPFQKYDYRVLRGGVFPDVRRFKINTTRHVLFLKYLFEIGAKRVFTDVFEDNIPSIKSLRYAGYKYWGTIQVLNIPLFNRQFVRWC